MRYYSIAISGGEGSAAAFPPVNGAPVQNAVWSSQINGQNDPGALNIEFDIISSVYATPTGGSWLRVWGIPLEQISQASQLNKRQIDVYAGMAAGLPLANPKQQGLIAHGSVWPAFGNWLGTDMTLEMILTAPFTKGGQADTPSNPAPIVHAWRQGQNLGDAVKQALATAFPDFTVNVAVSKNLKINYDDTGIYPTIEAYSGYLMQISQAILGTDKYPGVQVSTSGKEFTVSDGTSDSADDVIEIAFQDLIGQPTWLGFNVISVKTVMRGDVRINKTLKLPQTPSVTSAASSPQFRQNSSFQGNFRVRQVRHIGNFRQPDAGSWCSIYECYSVGNASDQQQ